MRSKRVIASAAACAFLVSCSVGTDFERPQISAQLADTLYINAPQSTDAQPMSAWWERINDAQLSAQVRALLSENLSLKQAAERINQAQAQREKTIGTFYPDVENTLSTSRQRQGGSTLYGGRNVQYFNTYDTGISVSWQVDLFGRTRRAAESVDARYDAARYDAEALKHSLIAELVQRRVRIATQQRLLQLAQEHLTNRRLFYTSLRGRYESGVSEVVLSDVYLAENSRSSVEADIHNITNQLKAEQYLLDVLLGKIPAKAPPAGMFALLPEPLAIPVCLPAHLLDRRPDLKASELRAKAANADIGVAVGDLYPKLNLGGTIGASSINDTSFFASNFIGASLLASLTTKLFDGGQLRAVVALREAEARELAAAYSEQILNAMREVETALVGEQELLGQMRAAEASAKALGQADNLGAERYSAGLLSLQDYLNTQQQRYVAEQTLLQIQEARWQNRLALYMALGGDWFDGSASQRKPSADACEKEALSS